MIGSGVVVGAWLAYMGQPSSGGRLVPTSKTASPSFALWDRVALHRCAGMGPSHEGPRQHTTPTAFLQHGGGGGLLISLQKWGLHNCGVPFTYLPAYIIHGDLGFRFLD